jgi:toxin-antitoxin system PIN domain toxin
VIIPDVNLLLYAVITGFSHHDPARKWWEATLNGTTPVGLTPVTVFGFLRISTNPRVFTSPLPIETAIEYVEQWLDRPHVELLSPGPQHFTIAFELLRSLGIAGNLTTDVQLAACAIEHHGELHSNDTDFARFPKLRWVNPLA